MTVREELVRDIEVTDRLLHYSGHNQNLRQRLLEQKAAMMRELAALDAAEEKKRPRRNAKVIEFPRNPNTPRKTG